MATNITQNLSTPPNQAVVSAVAADLNSKVEGAIEGEGEGGVDFLSLILGQLNKKGEEPVGETLLPLVEDEVLPNIEILAGELEGLKELPEEIKNLLPQEATFVQILQVLEQLGDGKELKTLPKLTHKLDSLFKDAKILEEFKGAKSIKDVLALSKKYDLGLENIKITAQDIKKLEKSFPKLAQKEFFKQVKTQISSEQILKNSAKKSKPKEETTTLSALLKDIKKPKKIDAKNSTIDNDVDILKNSINEKDVKKSTKKADTSKIEIPKDKIDEPKKTDISATDIKTKVKKEISGEQQTKQVNSGQNTPLNPNVQTNTSTNTNVNTNANTNANSTELSSEKTVNLQDDAKQSSNEDTNKNNSNQSGFAKEVGKADTLNVKSSNMRHTLNTFAQEFKEKVEEYKPPVMKVQMSLNPKSLGEMEVTLINRGNNLHVNITSNTNAMNVFLQNQAEFKNSLVNMGFTNLEMNFSDQRQAQDGKQSGSKFASYGEEGEEGEEIATEDTVLEIVLPDYV